MTFTSGDPAAAQPASAFSRIVEVPATAPLSWLAAGWADFTAAPLPSLFYGAAFAIMGWALAFFYRHAYSLTAALMGGFMLLGPGLAMGLYALSRQREQGRPVRLIPSLSVWRSNLSNLSIYALITGIVFLIWARASLVVFALFYSTGLPTAADFLRELASLANVEFVVAYLLVGACFAAFIFAVSVVAVPLMLDHNQDAVSAMLVSLAVVARNPGAMLFWAATIAALAGIGFATAFLGLALTIPLLGHASWHAYRALLPQQGADT